MKTLFRSTLGAVLALVALSLASLLLVGARYIAPPLVGLLCAVATPFLWVFSKLPQPVQRALFLADFRLRWMLAEARWHVGRALHALQFRLGLVLQAFPGSVTTDLAFGVIGELAFDGPVRTQPARINHGTAADIVVGRWFTLNAAGEALPGGTGAIGGVLCNPKTMASLGTAANGSAAPTLTIPTGTIGEFLYMGCIIVPLSAAVAIGAAAKYNTTTGVILSGAPGAGEAAIPNSKFIRYANAAAGLAVLELTN